MQCEKHLIPPLLVLKIEKGDHEPRNASGLEKLEKIKKQGLPQSLQKGMQLCHHLGFISAKSLLDF